MGQTDPELNPEYLRAVLQVLQEYKVAEFKCSQFSLTFEAEQEAAPPEQEEEGLSTDVRGFVAPSAEDEDDDFESRLSGHRALLGLRMPSLSPPREAKVEAVEPTPPYSVFKKV